MSAPTISGPSIAGPAIGGSAIAVTGLRRSFADQVVLDGQVAGTWRYDRDRIRIEAFGRITRTARGELDEEAERLAAFHR